HRPLGGDGDQGRRAPGRRRGPAARRGPPARSPRPPPLGHEPDPPTGSPGDGGRGGAPGGAPISAHAGGLRRRLPPRGPPGPGARAALLEWGCPISGKALRRIASDAELTPILVSAKGDPLHVGRKYRTATPKMRKALAERDRHCVWPGCPDPPEWTQGHHEV